MWRLVPAVTACVSTCSALRHFLARSIRPASVRSNTSASIATRNQPHDLTVSSTHRACIPSPLRTHMQSRLI
jgi:hypothetical protein